MNLFYRPRSIVSLILVGFAVVLTPFVIAVVTAVIQVDRFATESSTAVINGALATEYIQSLVEQSTEMQRALGQYSVVGDRGYYDIYTDRRAAFRNSLTRLVELKLERLDPELLQSLADDEAAIHERIDGTDGSRTRGVWEPAIESLSSVAGRSRELRTEIGLLVQENARQANSRADSLQRTLLAIAGAAAPATVVLIVIFTVLITRPMNALGSAIRRLGAHALDAPVTVEGPRDIESLAGELEWLRQRIKALEDQKATFLQHISHELKTPLTTIREGSDLLAESLGDASPEDAEIVRLLQKNGRYLQELIENLLHFARTQDLAIDLKFEPDVDIARLIEEVVASLSVIIDAKELVVRTRLAKVSARCDESKIRTVLDNLLTNAIKFTPERGHVEITLSADAQSAVVDVTDSGSGVADDDRPHIFEPFRKGSAEYASSVKGTGLGLSIAREYVEAHGGTIELLSSDSGAHFRVVLPLAGPAVLEPVD